MERFIVYCLYRKNIASKTGYLFNWIYTTITETNGWPDPDEVDFPKDAVFFFYCKAENEEKLKAKLLASGNNSCSIIISAELFMSIVGDFYFIGELQYEGRECYVHNKNTNTSTPLLPRMQLIKP